MFGLPIFSLSKSKRKRKSGDSTPQKSENPRCPEFSSGIQIDEVEIDIEGVTMRLKRKGNLEVPHEISAFIPRAEIRRRKFEDGHIVCEEEMLLNSITIVHAPRYPLAGESPSASESVKQEVFSPGPEKKEQTSSNVRNGLVPRLNLKYGPSR